MAAMTAPVTSITFTNKASGQYFCVRFLQDGTGGRIVTQSYNLTCLPTLAANIATRQWYVVKADGTTIEGNGCVSSQGTPAGVAVSGGTTGTLSSNAPSSISFSVTDWDTSGGALHSTSSNQEKFIATGVGTWHYQLICEAHVSSVTATYSYLYVGKNGTTGVDRGSQIRPSTQNNGMLTVSVVELNASNGDYATCNFQSDATTAIAFADAKFQKLAY